MMTLMTVVMMTKCAHALYHTIALIIIKEIQSSFLKICHPSHWNYLQPTIASQIQINSQTQINSYKEKICLTCFPPYDKLCHLTVH